MNYLYGLPLYEMNEVKDAYVVTEFGRDFTGEVIINDDFIRSLNEQQSSSIVVSANMENTLYYGVKLLINALGVLYCNGYDFGIVTINPKVIRFYTYFSNLSEFLKDRLLFLCNNGLLNTCNLWLYFNGFINKDLECIIKLRYGKLVETRGSRTYIHIFPQENFNLIYDLIDDIFKLC